MGSNRFDYLSNQSHKEDCDLIPSPYGVTSFMDDPLCVSLTKKIKFYSKFNRIIAYILSRHVT